MRKNYEVEMKCANLEVTKLELRRQQGIEKSGPNLVSDPHSFEKTFINLAKIYPAVADFQ